jgi:hypothetical protein
MQHLAEVYIIERIGVHHPRRVELHEFLDRVPPVFSVVDYLGWNPQTAPPAGTTETSAFRLMTDALLKCWFAHSLQLSLGCSLVQVQKHPYGYGGRGANGAL